MQKSKMLINRDLILEKIKIVEKMRVADLGCGTHGHFIFPVAQLVGKYGTVYAVDILKDVLESINKQVSLQNFKNIKTIWTNLEIFGSTKIESGSLDIALLINMLYQSDKRSEVIREAARLLKKDGKLFIADWKEVPLGPPQEKKVKINALKIILEKAGFRIQEEFDVGQYHFGMISIKN